MDEYEKLASLNEFSLEEIWLSYKDCVDKPIDLEKLSIDEYKLHMTMKLKSQDEQIKKLTILVQVSA